MNTLSTSRLAAAIKSEAEALGFDQAGIAAAEPLDGRHLHEWLADGCHGGMAWMARNPEMRLNPALLLPGCRSVLMTASSYYGPAPQPGAGTGIIARYARGEDYHFVLRRKLRELVRRIQLLAPGTAARICIDSAPLHEKSWAVRAGIGWQGKNTLIISPQAGSLIVLGALLLDIELEPDAGQAGQCGRCRRCIKACPTGALSEPGRLDARRCLAYYTIEHSSAGPIPDEIAQRMGRRIFGCDICQEVCPFNRQPLRHSREPAFAPRPLSLQTPLAQLAALSEGEFAAAFDRTPVIRATWSGFLRQVQTALAQTSTPAAKCNGRSASP